MLSSAWSTYVTYFSLCLPLPKEKKFVLLSLALLTAAPSLQVLPLFTDDIDTIVYRLCSKQDHSHDSLNKIKLQALRKKTKSMRV